MMKNCAKVWLSPILPFINDTKENIQGILDYCIQAKVSKEEGVKMAKNGEIQGVGVAHRNDTEYLRTLPDETENYNLGNLPSVTK